MNVILWIYDVDAEFIFYVDAEGYYFFILHHDIFPYVYLYYQVAVLLDSCFWTSIS